MQGKCADKIIAAVYQDKELSWEEVKRDMIPRLGALQIISYWGQIGCCYLVIVMLIQIIVRQSRFLTRTL